MVIKLIEERVYGDNEAYQLVLPRINVSSLSTVTLSSDLDGDLDVQYKIKFNLTYTMTAQRYLRFLINGSAPTSATSVNSWYGYWLGTVTPTSDYQSYLNLARPHGNGRIKGWCILDALTGDGVRTLESYYTVRDTTNGFLKCQTGGWWDNTTTKITQLGLQLYNGDTFSGWIELYKLKETWSEL